MWNIKTYPCTLPRSHETVLVIGAEKVKMPCQKMLLAYHSAFFGKITSRISSERSNGLNAVLDAAFYGGFLETQFSDIEMPEATAEQMSTFISWC
jgi:hypothetical protein